MNDEKRAARWRCALHESAHLVAASVLLGLNGKAKVGGSEGLTIFNHARSVNLFQEAVEMACGAAAELLAESNPAPAVEPPREAATWKTSPYGALSGEVREGTESDEERIARWCCLRRPYGPGFWSERHCRITSAACEFVHDHGQEIVSVATELYGRGIVNCGESREEEEDEMARERSRFAVPAETTPGPAGQERYAEIGKALGEKFPQVELIPRLEEAARKLSQSTHDPEGGNDE